MYVRHGSYSKLKQLSAYVKPDHHVTRQTIYGGLVTLFGVTLALILFCNEFLENFRGRMVQEMMVDTDRHEELQININITTPSLPCQVLSLDSIDIAGSFETDSVSSAYMNIHKQRLDKYGKRIGTTEYKSSVRDNSLLGALGALNGENQQVGKAMDDAMTAHEGCNIYGTIQAQRVAGNFHVSVHTADFLQLKSSQAEITDSLYRLSQNGTFKIEHNMGRINVSHIINSLSFGPPYPGQINPLDQFHRHVEGNSGTYKYFLKVVPTEYVSYFGHTMATNQYSVSEYYQPVPKGTARIPAVYFYYDLSPIKVRVKQVRGSITHFLVRFCAVIGGCFAVTGMIDQWVQRIINAANVKPRPSLPGIDSPRMAYYCSSIDQGRLS